MEIVTRAQWNARPPTSATALTLSKVDKFIVHYSGASRSQTVRSIQDYCMDIKGHSDIDYNAIVKDGKHYIGRGYNIGGHTLNNNSTSYGCCVVGNDGDATDADMDCVRDTYETVCAKLGRRIQMTHHRGVLGANYTSCPGSELEAWVNAGMPYKTTTGGDMSDAYDLLNKLARVEGNSTYTPEGPDGNRYGSLSNAIAVAAIQRAERDARLAADGVAELKAKLESLLAAIAKAITDEIGS